MKDVNKTVKILFFFRICLWIIAIVSTAYWMHLSNELYRNGIFDPLEFAGYFRPVFYPCVIIAFVSIGISFALYVVSKHLKKTAEDAKKDSLYDENDARQC